MADQYIPTTQQIEDGYSIDPEAEYHDPLTNHTAINRRAFKRWLAENNRQVAEAALLEYAEALEGNIHAAVWDHKDFVFDVQNWASERLSAPRGRWMSDEELAEHDLHVAVSAWDEGYSHCFECPEPGTALADNPYRKQTTNDSEEADRG